MKITSSPHSKSVIVMVPMSFYSIANVQSFPVYSLKSVIVTFSSCLVFLYFSEPIIRTWIPGLSALCFDESWRDELDGYKIKR